jgi:ParB/RepB/Spo0J family partition protein
LEKQRMPETPVLEFDPADCIPSDDNRPADDRPGIKKIVESILIMTQLVPGLVCPHPELAGKYLILDGVGRWYACQKLGLMFKAMLMATAISEPERIKLRLQHNVIRRNMTPDEIADDAKRYIGLTNCTQEMAAKELSLTPSTLSRALTVNRRIPPNLKAMAELVRPSIVAMIASLPKVEAMQQSLEYATTPGKDGRLPTRDQVACFIEQFKKTRGTKPKTLKGVVEGRKVELSLLPDESTESVIKFLKALTDRIGKYRELPPDSLGFLFNGEAASPTS